VAADVIICLVLRFKFVYMVAEGSAADFTVILIAMKRILIGVVLLLMVGAVRAQKVYFIYIQSDNRMPFFVKMGDKVTSSTASGYLILSKLVDSAYQFTIGKTGDAAAESRFSVTINKQDRGFLLKESEGRFGLFDLQALTLLSPLASAATSGKAVAKRTDAFTVLLAQAANDPSLLEVRTAATITAKPEKEKKVEPGPAVAIIKEEPEMERPALQSEQADSIIQTATANTETAISPNDTDTKDTASAPQTEQTVSNESEPNQTPVAEEIQTYTRSVVTRKSESSTSEGFGLTFLDEAEGAVDTIRIIIPNQAVSFQSEANDDADSKKFLNITNADSARDTSVAAANETIRAAEKKKRRGCAAEASEKEFFKLRKNMAAEGSDDAMIKEAQKYFKRSCFSTAQIKNLGSLFLTASSKYQFFDAAYGHVSNPEQYAVLQSELNDDYYVNRFKVLIAKQ
jgi:hypothetical protein